MSSSKILKNNEIQPSSFSRFDVRDVGEASGRKKASELKAKEILRKAREEKEAIERDAYNKGLKQGQEQGKKVAIKRLEPLFETLDDTLKQVSSLRETLTQKHMQQMLDIVLMVAEKVIHRQINLSPEIIVDTIQAASLHLSEEDEVRVRLNPFDFEYMRDIEEIISRDLTGGKQIHIIEDSSVERGGALLETGLGDIDATIGSQLERIRDILSD
ncbi:MAG: FliH/SctL family protein [Thermodesulfobacteriota bacterium]|nr:FliH/SctL family protein [Thermodesulfobacteriota bacterium]